MARPLRIQVAGGWYHVTSRGNRREAIYRTEADRRRFMGLVAELPERFGLEVHAFVLMDNHYHLLVRLVEPNLSEAMRWLHVSYSGRFNWAHRQCGHVFQGRFKAILIEEQRRVVEVARYLHLNPVRVGRLGLGKSQQKQARAGHIKDPGAERVRQRLEELNGYPWSSWRVYGGAEPAPGWLETGVVGAGCGGRSRAEQRRALRDYTERPVRQGRVDSPWEGLIAGMVLGSQEFAQRLMKQKKGRGVDAATQTSARQIGRRQPSLGWATIVAEAEAELGRGWREMNGTWGDWGRDGTIYVAVKHGRQRLSDVVRAIAGLTYGAGAQAVRRFGTVMSKDPAKSRFVEGMKRRLRKRREE